MVMGICFIHAIGKCGENTHWLLPILMPCINGFAFVSGWYGIRFSLGKFFKLILISIFSGLCVLVFAMYFGWMRLDTNLETVILIRQILLGNWYLCAYFLLMLISPGLNMLVEMAARDYKVLHALGIPFGAIVLWNWSSMWPYLNRIIPMTPGLGSFTVTSLAITYVVARYLRVKAVQFRTKMLGLVAAGAFLAVATGVWAGCYSSPFAIALAGSTFLCIERIQINVPGRRWIMLLAPSCFPVILIHSNQFGLRFMRVLESALPEMLGARVVLVAMSVFMISVLLDIPRRIVFRLTTVVYKMRNQGIRCHE